MLAGMVYLEASKKPTVNWFPSYHNEDKIPLGTYVLHTLLKDTFKDNFEEINQPPFEALRDSTLTGTYFFVNDYINFDKVEFESLYTWAEKGNTVFVAANSFSEYILDSLNVEVKTAILFETMGTKPMLNLVNKNLKTHVPYLLNRDIPERYFVFFHRNDLIF